ncbi:MAG: phosphate-starvation-inducible PsiE family protein [Sulfurovum sp.]|jgi:uncharacterized membrane protein (DUF373 family)
MKKNLLKIQEFLGSYFEVVVAAIVFVIIFATNTPFSSAIILMLEFIVVMEVVKMIHDFIQKKKIRLRFVVDIFIIFLIRDVIILSTHQNRDYFDITFLLFVISIFFIFRILAIKFSPGVIKISQDAVVEYEDERPSVKVKDVKDKIERINDK